MGINRDDKSVTSAGVKEHDSEEDYHYNMATAEIKIECSQSSCLKSVVKPAVNNDEALLLQRRTAIAVTEFPDYVQRMMREDQNKKSMLANDYNVSVYTLIVLQHLLPTYSSFHRIFKNYPKQISRWLVSLITYPTIDSRIYTHVRVFDTTYNQCL